MFLTSAAMDLVVPMDFQQGSHASCLVERRKLAFLSSCKSSLRLPDNFHDIFIGPQSSHQELLGVVTPVKTINVQLVFILAGSGHSQGTEG